LVGSLSFILCTACLFIVSSVAIGEPPSKPTLATSVSVEVSMKSFSPPMASLSTGLWTLLGSQPPGRDGHGFVYDSKADRFIVFGGAVSGTGVTNSTWSYDYTNKTWTNITPDAGPSPRAGAGMAYDSGADRVVLFGGSLAGNGLVGDTWSFDYSSDTWSNRTPSPAPAPRSLGSLVYDNVANRTILFGGGGASGPLGDTWTYDYGTNSWELLSANSPGALFGPSMTYDAAADRVLLFGGAILGITPVWMNDTWVLSVAARTWTNAHPLSSPAARGGAPSVYNSVSDVTLLFGGTNTFANSPSGYFNDTWAYNATANVWSNVSPVHSPSPRSLSGLAYDPIADRTVLFGGDKSGIPYSDAWAFQYSRQASSVPPSAPRNLQASEGDTQVTLMWEAPDSNGSAPVTDYRIYRGTVPGEESPLTSAGNVLTYTDRATVNGQTYYYEVAAVNAAGEGPKSNEAPATPSNVPTIPRNLAATGGQSEVTLNWVAPVSDGGSSISGYKVYRATSAGTETLLNTVEPVLSYKDSGLTNGLTYYYQVSALNDAGEGPKSNEASATPSLTQDTTPPTITITAPANNADVSSTIVTVSGTASDNVAVAKVEVSADGATWTTASGTTPWTAEITIHLGSNILYARATDVSGNQATTHITVVGTSPTATPLGLTSPLIAGFGIAVLLVAALTVLLLNRQRRRSE
jgi:fibronectin type 3 domain-containing protein